MAYITLEVYSEKLKRQVQMNVLLPADSKNGKADKPYKTIYLLHGLTMDRNEWLTYSRIREWAEEKKLAVVMPSGENSFYIDSLLPNHEYGAYIGEELVEITRDIFPLSNKRENTFIGGLSMGGFGALRNGLKYHETFGAIIALSSAIHFMETENFEHLFHEEYCFGPLEEAKQTDKNPRYIVKQMLKEKAEGKEVHIPEIYMACGTEDNLITANRCFRDFLRENNIPVDYTEENGIHNWDFWNKHFNIALNRLPL